ncbi:MAG: uracil-DNA glycosylase [FCB group bacterium]|nr:uracil-DNA glycosylase [FCB group bacterium]
MGNSDMFKKLSDYMEARRELEGGLYLSDEVVQELKRAVDGAGLIIESLEEYGNRISGCVKCDLGKTRTKFVFGKGNPQARLVFIGEAPGRDEDLQGLPFVGRAGKLLDELLEESGFSWDEVYICNILKCRPPENRDPRPEEIELCEPYLWRQLEMIDPEIMVALGRVAAQTLLRSDATLGNLRKTAHKYRDVPLFVTYHPAFILRNNNFRSVLVEDLKRFRQYFLTGDFG